MRPITNTTHLPTFSVPDYTAGVDSNARLIGEWEAWERAALPGSGEYRYIALGRLKDCLKYHITRLDFSGLQLTELPAHFPDFVQIVCLNNNYLTRLPAELPMALTEMYVNNNRLCCLPAVLPTSLQVLDIHNNCVTRLPENLPDYLELLNADHNRLRCLPERLPVYLKVLYVSGNRLRRLPDNLPDFLEELSINHNRLTQLPSRLPVSLEILCVNNNVLTYLPDNLPDAIDVLEISHNRISRLPSTLPFSLDMLHVSYNQLTALPENLPDLSALYASHNQLTQLPAQLPGSLEVLTIEGNPIPSIPDNLPESLISIDIFLNHRQNRSFYLLDTLLSWNSDVDLDKWRSIENEDNIDNFVNFLKTLRQGKNRHHPELKQRVARWLDYLAEEGRQILRAQTFAIAQDAAESCVDRASFYFNKMHILQVEHQLIETPAPLPTVVETIQGLFRLQVLEQVAAKKVAERRRVSPDFAEDLEIYLAYQHKLRVPLALPVYTKFQFSPIAGISDDDLRVAHEEVAAAEKADFVHYWLTESALWTAVLEKWDAEKKGQAEESYLDAISSDSFNAAVSRELREKGIAEEDEDAHRNLSQNRAAALFFQQRYQLTRQLLAAHQELSLFEQFSLPPSLCGGAVC